MASSDLSPKDLKEIIRNSPIPSIDLIVKNPEGRILLGMRRNAPAQDTWFVPGGRVRKDEATDTALRRIIKHELNLDSRELANNTRPSFYTNAEHFYPDNVFDDSAFGTHYVVRAYLVDADPEIESLPTEQHKEYRWFDPNELISDDRVHRYTREYFIPPKAPLDFGLYRSLMSHHLHYDRQMWGRTQLLVAVQAATLAVWYQFRCDLGGFFVMLGSLLLTLAIWRLIARDRQNRDVNIPVMDEIVARRAGAPSWPRIVSLRSTPKGFRGLMILYGAFISFLLLDLGLAISYFFHTNIISFLAACPH
jgi:colanic acid biosynthesis protein WcaH